MKFKILIGLLIFSFFLVNDSSYANIRYRPKSSPSQFFIDDSAALDHEETESEEIALPTNGKFWPVDGVLTGHFGKWRGGKRRGHTHVGIDIAAPYGTPVVAPVKGEVVFTGRKGGYGLAIILDHGDGVYTLYGHNSKVLVKEGDIIKKGQVISKVGSSGRSTGPHLHYEVRVEGNPVNPIAWTTKLQSAKS